MNEQLESIAHRVIGAAIGGHKNLGQGYLESVYEDALPVELKLLDLRFANQSAFGLDHKGHKTPVGVADQFLHPRAERGYQTNSLIESPSASCPL
jgi:GxxExxY protein